MGFNTLFVLHVFRTVGLRFLLPSWWGHLYRNAGSSREAIFFGHSCALTAATRSDYTRLNSFFMPRKANVSTGTNAGISTSELAPHVRKSKFDASAPAWIVHVLFQASTLEFTVRNRMNFMISRIRDAQHAKETATVQCFEGTFVLDTDSRLECITKTAFQVL